MLSPPFSTALPCSELAGIRAVSWLQPPEQAHVVTLFFAGPVLVAVMASPQNRQYFIAEPPFV